MHIIIDARRQFLYAPLTAKVTGATELLLRYTANTLHKLGHRVDVVSTEKEEHWVDGVYWWTAQAYPTKCDLLIGWDQLLGAKGFNFKHLGLWLSFSEPSLGEHAAQMDFALCLSDYHREQLLKRKPQIQEKALVVLPPPVDWEAYQGQNQAKDPARIIWCNSADRGLWHLMELWPELKKRIAEVSLVITYDLAKFLERVKWNQDFTTDSLWRVLDWAKAEPSVTLCEGLDRAGLIREQLRSGVFAYTCDPPDIGSMVHCIAALECAAADCILVMPELEGYPSIFGEAALMSKVPIDHSEWVNLIEQAIWNREKLQGEKKKARELARAHSLSAYGKHWEKLLGELNGHS